MNVQLNFLHPTSEALLFLVSYGGFGIFNAGVELKSNFPSFVIRDYGITLAHFVFVWL